MLIELSVVPLGAGESVSEYVSGVLDIIDSSGLSYRVNPMATVIEGEWDDVMKLVKDCHERVRGQGFRTITTIKIDDRPGKGGRLDRKIESLEDHLGRKLRK